ncbi:hypothetical protein [Celeribacter naphthalenivorans]|uniref:hypothetical protein n=1 Tax=Celeribacter naphthalenivorans TaxID=1614694 RepID=UPI001CF9FCC0|nr:hypothetical protein [Celeribacter naphthalenivorans]
MTEENRSPEWFRNTGLLFLALSGVSLAFAVVGKKMALNYPDYAAAFSAGKYLMVAGSAFALVCAYLFLSVYIRLRRESDRNSST